MAKKFAVMTIDELEAFRAERQAEIEAAQAAFMEAGRVLNAKLQRTELEQQHADLERQAADIETKLENLGD